MFKRNRLCVAWVGYKSMSRDLYAKPFQAAEWESSFSQIMERTRQNINRISSRYSTESVDPMPGRPMTGAGAQGVLATLPPPPPSTCSAFKENVHVHPSGSTVLDSLIARVAQLEASQGTDTGGEARVHVDGRLCVLEGNVEELHATMNCMVGQIKDVHKLSAATAQQVNRQGAVLESVQQELDLRRGTVARMDSWARQGEAWREEIESQLSGISKSLRAHSRSAEEQAEATADRASKTDLKELTERMHMLTQQAVAASCTAHSEKMEQALKVLERQMAAVRAGRTVGNGGKEPNAADMTEAEVADAFAAPQPSELMVRSMVQAEVRELEGEVEGKIEAHVVGQMRAAVAESGVENKRDLKEYLTRIAAELGLVVADGDEAATSAAARVVAARKAVETEVRKLADKVDDCSIALMGVQQEAQNGERTLRVEMRGLERRVDESAATATAAAAQVTSRAGSLEEAVKDVEASQRLWHRQLRDELYATTKEHYDGWSGDRMELDKRVIVVEKIVDKFSEKLTTSRDALESLLAGSPEMKQIYSTGSKVDSLTTEVQSMRSELRENSGAVTAVRAAAAGKKDVGELKERLQHMEALTGQLKGIGAMHTALGSTEAALSILKTSVDDAESRIQKLSNNQHGLETRTEGDGKRALTKFSEIEERLKVLTREQSLQAELGATQMTATRDAVSEATRKAEQSRVLVKDVANAAAQAAAQSAVSAVEHRALSFQSAVDGRVSKLESGQDLLRHAVLRAQKAAEEAAAEAASSQALSSLHHTSVLRSPARVSDASTSATSSSTLPPVADAQSPPKPSATTTVTAMADTNADTADDDDEKLFASPSPSPTPSPVASPAAPAALKHLPLQEPLAAPAPTKAQARAPVPVVNLDLSTLSSNGSVDASADGTVPGTGASPSTVPSPLASPEPAAATLPAASASPSSALTGGGFNVDAYLSNSDTASAEDDKDGRDEDVFETPSPGHVPRTVDVIADSNGKASNSSLNLSVSQSSDYDDSTDAFADIEEVPTVDRVRDKDDELRSAPIDASDSGSPTGSAAGRGSGDDDGDGDGMHNRSAIDESMVSAAESTFHTVGGTSPGYMLGNSDAGSDGVMAFGTPPESPDRSNVSRDTASSVEKSRSVGANTPTPTTTTPTAPSTPKVSKSASKADSATKTGEKKLAKKKISSSSSSAMPTSIATTAVSTVARSTASAPCTPTVETALLSDGPVSGTASGTKKGARAGSGTKAAKKSTMPPMPKLPPDEDTPGKPEASTPAAAATSATAAAAASSPTPVPIAATDTGTPSAASATKGLSAKERLRMKLQNRKLAGTK